MWDAGGDAFDSMEDVGFLEFAELSLDEPELENELITQNVDNALGVPVDRLVQAADFARCLFLFLFAYNSIYFLAFEARQLSKTIGGGMRQIGLLCAATFVAFQENVGRLEMRKKEIGNIGSEPLQECLVELGELMLMKYQLLKAKKLVELRVLDVVQH
ncbi:hypothetical protein JHK85_040367 [Glycine max]|nr:hypothetical protein JHK86_039789 [Glycine max]KAG4965392.1 hypothetical protein JHK85_040367 [Glycine max]